MEQLQLNDERPHETTHLGLPLNTGDAPAILLHISHNNGGTDVPAEFRGLKNTKQRRRCELRKQEDAPHSSPPTQSSGLDLRLSLSLDTVHYSEAFQLCNSSPAGSEYLSSSVSTSLQEAGRRTQPALFIKPCRPTPPPITSEVRLCF